MSVGGGLGEVFVVDNEKIGTFGDLFEAGPTELDRRAIYRCSRRCIKKIIKQS